MKFNRNRIKRKNHTSEIVLKRMQLYFNSCDVIVKNEKETQTISKLVYLHSEASRYITTKLEIMKNDGVFENLLTKDVILQQEYMLFYSLVYKYFYDLPYVFHELMKNVCYNYHNSSFDINEIITDWVKSITYFQFVYIFRNLDDFPNNPSLRRDQMNLKIINDIFQGAPPIVDSSLFIILPMKEENR